MVSEKIRKPSIEKPWLKLFSEEAKKSEFPKDTIYNVIKGLSSSRLNNYAIDYYGNELTYRQFMEEVDIAAGSLESLGVKSGDIIACNSATIPEMIVLLYASNKIGATMLAIDPRRTSSFIKNKVTLMR